MASWYVTGLQWPLVPQVKRWKLFVGNRWIFMKKEGRKTSFQGSYSCFQCNWSNFNIILPKNWCFWTVVLEKTLESPLGCKEIQPVHPRGDQSWVIIGRTDAEAETPTLWPPDVKSWLIWKDPDARKNWGQEEKGMTEDEMVGWHHRLNGHGFGWTPGVGDGQGGLVCCSSWGLKESDMTEWLNWADSIEIMKTA